MTLAQHQTVALRTAEQFAVAACPEYHHIRRTADFQTARVRQSHDIRGRPGHRHRPVTDRIIELRDAYSLGEHLGDVEIAIGVKRIAGVIAGNGNRNVPAVQLVKDRHTAPSRRLAVVSSLQEHIAHGETGNAKIGFRRQFQRALDFRRRTNGQTAAMSDIDRSVVTVADQRLANIVEGFRLRVAHFVDVEIERQPAFHGKSDDEVEQAVGVLLNVEHGAEDTPILHHHVRDLYPEPFVGISPYGFEAHCLQRDAVRPGFPDTGEDGPRYVVLRRR